MKTIGLFDLDSRIPNLPLMKISTYYKKWGYKTEFYSPLFHSKYWLIFTSKIFDYPSKNDPYIRKNMILGGSGHNLEIKLPYEIEHIYPDYDLYNCKYAMGFITRGCIRNCPWCIVPKKEGYIYKNTDLWEFTKNQRRVMLLDNNFLAYKNHIAELKILKDSNKQIDFNQGLDIRLITPENARLLKEIKRWRKRPLRFALDDINLIPIIEKKLKILFNAGFSNRQLLFYVLIGFNTTENEDLIRINFLKEYRIDPFIMPFDKSDYYQKTLTRYVNHKAIFWNEKISWYEYKKRSLKF